MFKFADTEIEGVKIITPRAFDDERGYFFEDYKKSEFAANGIGVDFVQNNRSFSKKNVLRGMHFQKGDSAQAKLVRCIAGEIFDVVVDLRRASPTFLRWVGVNLSAENKNQIFIPTGFAHGFCVLSDFAEIIYSCSAEYNPASEGGIMWNDPAIGIVWPLDAPLLSPKDTVYPAISPDFPGI